MTWNWWCAPPNKSLSLLYPLEHWLVGQLKNWKLVLTFNLLDLHSVVFSLHGRNHELQFAFTCWYMDLNWGVQLLKEDTTLDVFSVREVVENSKPHDSAKQAGNAHAKQVLSIDLSCCSWRQIKRKLDLWVLASMCMLSSSAAGLQEMYSMLSYRDIKRTV